MRDVVSMNLTFLVVEQEGRDAQEPGDSALVPIRADSLRWKMIALPHSHRQRALFVGGEHISVQFFYEGSPRGSRLKRCMRPSDAPTAQDNRHVVVRPIAKVVEAHAHVCGFLPVQSVYDVVFVEHGDASGVSKVTELDPVGPKQLSCESREAPVGKEGSGDAFGPGVSVRHTLGPRLFIACKTSAGTAICCY